MDPDNELEEEDLPESGRPARSRSLLLLGMVVCAGIGIGLIVFFFVLGPTRMEIRGLRKASNSQTATPQSARSPLQVAAPGETGKQAAGQNASTSEAGTAPEGNSPGQESVPITGVPVVDLPADADRFDLESLKLPPLPYCIYTGAYKDLREAATTQSELDSNYLSAYIVPVEIKGNVAQSLFGVTQDGLWYRVLTGHFSSKEEARKTLAVMMEELPGYQPEIMRFPYTLECGRFLVPDEARKLSGRLDKKGVYHYTQTYPTQNGGTLSRVLVGCFFSEHGAKDQAGPLEEKGFSCTVAVR